MALVTVRSGLVSNIVASPPVQNSVMLENGRQRSSCSFVTVTNGDSIGSIYKMARVMSHWRIQSLRAVWGNITSGTASLGLYRTDQDGGALVLAAAYAAGQSIATANFATGGLELFLQNRTIDKTIQQVWQDAGLAADPKLAYDLCFTLNAAATATAFLGLDAGFVVD